MHARAVVTRIGLRHEGRGLAVSGRHVPDRVLLDLGPVSTLHEGGETGADFALAGSAHFVVMHFNRDALLSEQRAHFSTDVHQLINRRNREIAALRQGAVGQVAAFILEAGGPGSLFAFNLVEAVLGIIAIADAVENEELEFRTKVSGVADAGGLQIGFSALREGAGITFVTLARVRFHNVAGEQQRVLLTEGVHAGRFRIRKQQHVGGLDASPALDRGTVKDVAHFELVFSQLICGDRDALLFAERISKAEANELHVVVFDHLEDVISRRHLFLLNQSWAGRAFLPGIRPYISNYRASFYFSAKPQQIALLRQTVRISPSARIKMRQNHAP